ncbi:MAG: DUF456 domain-containing protein [Anaerolineales bacterium]|nr:DUF456 domain-containing protein [Anaerolineales bacterium]
MEGPIQFFLLYVILFVMLLGLIGVVVPLLPGIELIWLAALGYGILHGFTWPGVFAMVGITILLLAGLSSDIWITGLGLKSTGTSMLSILIGVVLLVAGSIFLSPLGGILLGLGGMALLEFRRHRSWKKAVSSAGSALISFGLSYGFKLFVGLLMIGVWLIWVIGG